MASNIKNKFIKWWMTPYLPDHDIFEMPLLIDKTPLKEFKHLLSQWIIHPVKRRLSRSYLQILQKFTKIVVIGITGSAGKTTTKEMIYSILKLDGKTICTKGFIDPVYNIPNTILRTPFNTKYLILEMGVEYPGEMDFYLWLAHPDIGLITNIFPTHVEFLKDINGVLEEKSKLVKSISAEGFSVLNSGDPKLLTLKNKLRSRIIWFDPELNPILQNSNAARAVAEALNIDKKLVDAGLRTYEPPAHRLMTVNLKNGSKILDDSYNCNLEAAISTLKYFNTNFKGEKNCILGEMRELGKFTEESHRKLGKEISKYNFANVICVGESMKFLIEELNKKSPRTKTFLLTDYSEITNLAKKLLSTRSSLMVKGARSLRLDKIVTEIIKTDKQAVAS